MAARASDKFIPWYLVAFFAVLTVVFSGFGYIAHRTYPGVVMDDSYEKGLKYNDVIAKADAQEKLGWKLTVTSAHATDGRVVISAQLNDHDGAAISGATVKLWLVRPVQDGMDQHLVMREERNGQYTVTTALPAPGLWELHVEALKDSRRFQISQRTEI